MQVYLYSDEGVDAMALIHTRRSLEKIAPRATLHFIQASHIIQGGWSPREGVFIMPGGADVPYCEKLQGAGNHQIHQFVERGGAYLGLCAGGYYGALSVAFDPGGPLEVLGERELAFTRGEARGPLLAPYVYGSYEGARVARLSREGSEESLFSTYYNGGCWFTEDDQSQVFYRYENEDARGRAAVVGGSWGQGRFILSGVHPEYDPVLLKEIASRPEAGGVPFLTSIAQALEEDQSAFEVWAHFWEYLTGG